MRIPTIKNSVVLAAMVLFSCTVFVCAGETETYANEKSGLFNSTSFGNNELKDEKKDDTISSTLHRMTLAVLIVIVLGAAAIYGSKKILPKLSHPQGRKITIVETVHLGSRKSIHLLEVAGQQVLIGSTYDRITKLADIFSEKGFPLEQTDKSGGAA